MAYPLENLRVLDLSRVLAGPFAGRMLSDLGADVVKVEPPDGDSARLWGADIGGNPGYYHQQNVGKRNICIDLKVPAGAALIKALATHADVAIENFRPGVAARLGIGYGALQGVNPRLVMLSISGFGQDGPESDRAAYAPVIHAESGLIARQARTGGPRADFALSIADTNAGLHGLVAVLSALWMRERTGLGQHIDMAMIDATLVTDDGLHYALEDAEHTRMLPAELWDTAAGEILISADFRRIWRSLSSMYGVEDPSPPDASVEEKAAARRTAARAYFRGLPGRADVIAALDAMNLAWGQVRKSSGTREQPTVRHRGSITEVDDRQGGLRPVVQSPYRFSAAQSGVRGGAPWQGEHNAEVLRDWLGPAEAALPEWQAALVAPRG
ncbi:MAG: CaiB/BaiF CoA transferase family protein [Tepidiformaceae bacterium]